VTAERWRPVPGYEGAYEVSDLGRVRSLRRTVIRSNGRATVVRQRILRQSQYVADGRGTYRRVVLSKGGQAKNFTVHILVMIAFVGPRPQGMDICHENGDGKDNRLVNLRYDTHKANMADTVRHGTHPHARLTHCPQEHPYDEANTYRHPGGRQCRMCKRAADRTYYHRKKLRVVNSD
jgi:NUMOD4 motif/HNH endonuclease